MTTSTPPPIIRGGMQPAPLPWLTALLRPRVKDFIGVYTHILKPIGMAVHDASYTQLTDTDEIYLQARADTKQSFVNNVYYSTAPTETKRQLLEITFEEFFDLCVRELPNAQDDREDKSNDANNRL